MQSARRTGLIRFGVFELKKDTGELRKQGIKVRLQGKPLQLLEALLERPGELVTREELHKRLWPADADVDFENGLNTAANRLRLSLGDSAEHPRYVETLARMGYRFIAPIITDPEHSMIENGMGPAEPMPAPVTTPPKVVSGSQRAIWLLAAAALVTLALTGAVLIRRKPAVPLSFHQLTFRRMSIGGARFGPDGQTVIYEGREHLGKRELYLTQPSSPESRPLGFAKCTLASISHAGELALITSEHNERLQLLRVPLNGGAPLSLDKDISAADWTVDGRSLAVIRGKVYPSTVEFPRGKVVYQGKGWLSDLRVSPDGRSLAFMEHPVRGDDCGSVKIIDASGASRNLSEGWSSAAGLAWVPSGREIWFTAARTGVNRALYGVDLSGRLRAVASLPGTLTLLDISHSGRVLIALDQSRYAISGAMHGDKAERDLSWFDFSRVMGISEDGGVMLFDESGEGGGPHYSTYIRRAGGDSAIRVGEGTAMAISHDGKWAITSGATDRTRLNIVPLIAGETRTISGQGLNYDWLRIFPDDKRLLAGGSVAGGKLSLYTQTLDGAKPQRLNTDVYLMQVAISPDGKQIAGVDAQAKLVILPVDGGETRTIAMNCYAIPIRWSGDGKSLLVQHGGSLPAEVFRVDVNTGNYRVWKQMAPADPAGVMMLFPAVISRDENAYAYSFSRTLSELFVVDGWM